MVKKEKDILKKDLSTVNGTYTKEINDHISEINEKFEDNSLDTNGYRNLILKIIGPANDTPAKRNFILNLNRKRNKTEILFYVTSSYLTGSKMGVI